MPKRRMQAWMREELKKHAAKIVIPIKERSVLDAAYKKAAPLVRKAVEVKYPARDMRVLARYKCTTSQNPVHLHCPDGSVVEFAFEKEEAPRVAQYYGRQMYLADATTAAAAEAAVSAKAAYDEERKSRIAAYTALINGTQYVEDLIAVWPEAEGVLPANAVPIPLGPEQIALVKRDQKERRAA